MPDPLDPRRKRLIYRSQHTGMKETDLLLGPFARAHVPGFTNEQLECYERLLGQPDPDIFDWASGRAPVPEAHDTGVMQLLKNFHSTT